MSAGSHRKKSYLITGVVICIAIIMFTIYLFVWHKSSNADSSKTTIKPIATSEQPPALQVVNATGLQGSRINSSSTSQLTVSGADNAQQGDDSVVDPTSFSQYEKYASSPNTVFGDLSIGNGNEVKAGSKIAISYRGWLTSGKLFDQSKIDSNNNPVPFLFTEGGHEVISGMEEGIFGMKVGGRRLIIIPPAFGYGSSAQVNIPANSTLVFEVTLLAAQ